MCLSLFVFLKKNLMRWWNNFFLSSEDEEEEEEEEEEEVFAKNDDGISTGKKIEEKFSFRVLSYQKKKVHTKLLPSTASSQERTTKRALEGVRVCVCLCRFRATSRVNNTYTHTDRNGAKLVVWWRRPRRE